METHRRGERADKVEKELETAGWNHYLHSRAAVSTSEKEPVEVHVLKLVVGVRDARSEMARVKLELNLQIT